MTNPTLYIGLMSGTSLDGVDAVLADFSEAGGRRIDVRAHEHEPFPPTLRDELLALNSHNGANELHRAALAGNALARVYATAIERLLERAGISRGQVVAAGVHGQTVRHRPGEFDGIGYTVQLNNPALLAELCGLDIVADLRSRDVASGGQGAPLVPAFHRAVFGRAGEALAVLNLGGIANVTLLGEDGSTGGFDCGPANALMDHWASKHLGTAYDDNGDWAASGFPIPALLQSMLSEPFFSMAPPKSTGRDLFNPAWLDSHLRSAAGGIDSRPEDIQATLAELTVLSSVAALESNAWPIRELLICGGGALNAHLMRSFAVALPGVPVKATDKCGLPALQVEAAAFAWLAKAFVERRPGNLSAVTGARGPRVLGALYPR